MFQKKKLKLEIVIKRATEIAGLLVLLKKVKTCLLVPTIAKTGE